MKLTNKNVNDYITIYYGTTSYGDNLMLRVKGIDEPVHTSTYVKDIKKILKTTDLSKIHLGVTKSKRLYICTIDKYGFMKNIKYIYWWTGFIEREISNSLEEDSREPFNFKFPVGFLLLGYFW